MDKLKMQTPDLTDKNIEQIAALFPNVITETRDENGNLKKAVDFDLLKQTLSKNLVEGDDERYRLDWPGKKASLFKANTPINKTLRPCREESVNFDATENLYIEGDNFEVLKILQESYLGKVKMIYIDPPYNTGNDFIYKDDFKKSKEEYEEELGVEDEEGGKLFRNTDSNGRFHSDWLSMMYERLVVARDLLRDDGVIFISIDDNEVHNLRKICDEVFGENNCIGNTIRVSSPSQNISKFISIMHDYCLIYAKNKEQNNGNWKVNKNNVSEFVNRVNILQKENLDEKGIENELRALVKYPRFYDFDHYSNCDENGVYQTVSMGGVSKGNLNTEIIHPITGKVVKKPQGGWRYKDEEIKKLVASKSIYYGTDESIIPRKKLYLKDYLTQIPKGVNFFDSQEDVRFLKNNNLPFDFPKPFAYIKYFLTMDTYENDIILDFFSGSATTAHAVMQLNAEDSGNRKFIMVQLPEKTDENSEAHKAGYKTISDIGKERIRRAGKKILSELESKTRQLKLGEEPVDTNKLDIGFRVYKTDSTNMKDIFYHPTELKQEQLSFLESNIKEDRTPEDLLTKVILDLGLELSLPIETKKILGNTVFIVQTNALVVCFDNDIDFKIVDTIADLKPFKVVFKDASFKDDKDRINVEERFKRLSPETKVTVI
ncbi:MAG: site-specific DNA-methyltransferase [Planctomycetes bacterium]|nr:site-specific DNA-methyltransferase [Planctomycetota bacterium]